MAIVWRQTKDMHYCQNRQNWCTPHWYVMFLKSGHFKRGRKPYTLVSNDMASIRKEKNGLKKMPHGARLFQKGLPIGGAMLS